MKRAIMILSCVLVAGMAAAQNPSIIQNTRAVMQGVQANETRATNQALSVANPQTPAASTAASRPSASVVSTAPKAGAAKPSVAVAKAPAQTPAKTAVPTKTAAPTIAVKPAPKAPVAKGSVPKVAAKTVPAPAAKPVSKVAAPAPAPANADATAPKGPEKADGKWSMTGKRDPFISPVVYQTGPSNCASGKKCLEISAISLKGVVQSENGFIAVVTNNLNKAYFLRENDPVFDGYVVKITGDSIVFQETTQDKLGKTFTKEVVKKLTTPSV
jgi:hypothetical protein